MTVSELLKKSFAVYHGKFLNVRSKSQDECLACRCDSECVGRMFGGRTVESIRPELIRDGGLIPTMTIVIA